MVDFEMLLAYIFIHLNGGVIAADHNNTIMAGRRLFNGPELIFALSTIIR